MARFVVHAAPIGKGRPRCSCVTGKPRLRTPKATKAFERAVAEASRRLGVMAGPVAVRIVAVLPRPVSPPKGTPARDWRIGPRRPWVGRYDADNIAKAVLDGMTAVIPDDRQVVRLEVEKWCAAAGESPCVEVEVHTQPARAWPAKGE